MKKFNEIKAGYRLTVTSWENDADNYQTVIREGLTFNDVKFYKAFFYPLTKSYHQGEVFFGNMYEEGMKLGFVYALYDIVLNNFDVAPEHIKELHSEIDIEEAGEDDYEYFLEACRDLYGDFELISYDHYTRVIEKFRVELIPETVQIEDVTDQF